MMAVVGLLMVVAMFLIVFVLRSIVQKRRTGDSGLRAGGLSASFGSLEWVAGWLLVAAMLAALAAPIAEIVGLDPLTSNVWVRGTGVVIAAAGIALTFLAQISMGTEWRIGIDTTETTGLVTGGAFTIARNPIFSSMLITAVGLTLMVPSPISITGLIALDDRHRAAGPLRRRTTPSRAARTGLRRLRGAGRAVPALRGALGTARRPGIHRCRSGLTHRTLTERQDRRPPARSSAARVSPGAWGPRVRSVGQAARPE